MPTTVVDLPYVSDNYAAGMLEGLAGPARAPSKRLMPGQFSLAVWATQDLHHTHY